MIINDVKTFIKPHDLHWLATHIKPLEGRHAIFAAICAAPILDELKYFAENFFFISLEISCQCSAEMLMYCKPAVRR